MDLKERYEKETGNGWIREDGYGTLQIREKYVDWLEKELSESENRLLNAFQVAKAGKNMGHLKFDQFKERMNKRHDHIGNVVK